MKKFTAEDVQDAHDELCPHAQKLVDRFGQSQAAEIMRAVLEQTCPDAEMPEFMMLGPRPKATN